MFSVRLMSRPATGSYLGGRPGVAGLLGFSGVASEREIVLRVYRSLAREGTAADGAQVAVVGVLVQDHGGELVKCFDFTADVRAGDRYDHFDSPRRRGEERQQPVADERRGLFGRPLVHVHPQHVEARLNQSLSGLSVEVRLSV